MKNLRYFFALILIGTLGCLSINAQKQLKSPLKYSNTQKKKIESKRPASSPSNKRRESINNRPIKEEERQSVLNEPERMTQITRESMEENRSSNESIFTAVDQQAEFPGGLNALMKFLSSNIRYPESAQLNNIQGRVIVKFVVEKDGSISQAQVVRGVEASLDAEALRVVKMMPRWHPGKKDGRPVRCWFTIPITFKLTT